MLFYTSEYERESCAIVIGRIVRIYPSSRGGGTRIVLDNGEIVNALEHMATIHARISEWERAARQPDGTGEG